MEPAASEHASGDRKQTGVSGCSHANKMKQHPELMAKPTLSAEENVKGQGRILGEMKPLMEKTDGCTKSALTMRFRIPFHIKKMREGS